MSPSLFLHARNDVHTVARVHDTATRPFARLHLLGTHPKLAMMMRRVNKGRAHVRGNGFSALIFEKIAFLTVFF